MGVNGIYGLSGSGLDIESMVKVGMMSKQNEYDKMAQKFTKNEWTKAAYLELNSSITTFNASTLSQYKMSSTMNAKTAESTSSGVKVTANASAGIMTHQVTVNSLSSNAYLIGTNSMQRYAITSTTASQTSVNLADVLFSRLDVDSNGVVTGSMAAVTTANKNQTDEYGRQLNNAWVFGTDGTSGYPASGQVNLQSTAFSFKISDGNDTKEVSYTYEDLLGTPATATTAAKSPVTFNDLVSKINGLGLNIRAAYDSVNDKFSFYNSEGGAANNISITLGNSTNVNGTRADMVTRNFFDNMGLYQSKNGELIGNGGTTPVTVGDANSILFKLGGATSVSGTNGSITVDGVVYDKVADNKVTVGGITYTALAETSATVSVSQDVDSIVDKVKSFVADYNKLLSSLYEKYDEKPETGYTPLTQSQKDAMKDEQITKWEEKAKKGLLYHDQTLGKIINEMRESIYTSVDSVEGKYNSAYSIGISTTGLKGQLVLDEDKLRKALAEDSDAVYNVFAKLDNSKKDAQGNVVNNPSGNGIAQRLGDIFTTAMKNIKSRAGSSTSITEDSDLNTLLRNLQTKMSNFKKMMNSFENALYKKYDKMESTLASLGAQLNFVMGGNQ
ncbi:MAG: flagellar filament capping protein FliD [Quinella sp. 1Q7]|nr:flagellar filament capping protein FliD [Quinella sp. 1Q7]